LDALNGTGLSVNGRENSPGEHGFDGWFRDLLIISAGIPLRNKIFSKNLPPELTVPSEFPSKNPGLITNGKWPWGPFLESPGNFSGPKTYFKIISIESWRSF